MARFGSFEADYARRQLLRDGRDVHLTPKAFDLLRVLLDAAPRVVSKTELHERLWPRTFVADATLAGLVKELRRALDDSNPDAPLIRTINRVGYAFCAPLRPAERRAPDVDRWVAVGERRIRIGFGESVVGRDPGCALWLDHASVSRRHARILVSDDGAVLEDLGSKNGTTVGGRALSGAHRLHDGERLGFGRVIVVYRSARASLPTVTQTGWSHHLPLGPS
jgi:DNA-binding winged helix-turn-helix (wHTH) protein